VLGIDIDIREHNLVEIQKHPMFKRISLIEGSSTDQETIKQVRAVAKVKKKIMVILDSLHTHNHVLKELKLYSPLVTTGSYLIVFDTIIEDTPEDFFSDRPWGKGNNPKTAVWEYLRILKKESRKAYDGKPLHFDIDRTIENKLLITMAPDGYLKRVT
jgi:cephalosporin hydroxylase